MYVCPHSTNMESSKIDEALKGAKAANIKNILALRGGRCQQPVDTHHCLVVVWRLCLVGHAQAVGRVDQIDGWFPGTLLAPPLDPQDCNTSDRPPESLTRRELS